MNRRFKKIPPGRAGLMVVAAFRYCLGRMTYIVSDCTEWLIEIWPILPDNVKTLIERELEEAFVRDDEHRADGNDYKALGHDCDRAAWLTVRALYKTGDIK